MGNEHAPGRARKGVTLHEERERGDEPHGTAIRLFREEDFARVCVLEEGENGAPYPAAVFIRQASQLYPLTFFVSESGSSISGYAIGAISQDAPSDAWVLRLKVAPHYRQMRIGSALLHAIVAALRGKGVDTICLSVSLENAPARALYQKYGFTVIATEPGYFGDGQDRFIMILRV